MWLPLFLGATFTFPSVENRQKLRADELQREYHEEQRNEFENFVEEQNHGKIHGWPTPRSVTPLPEVPSLRPVLSIQFYMKCF